MTSNNKITPEKQKELNDKLLIAVEKGIVEEVTRLILEGAEVDFRDENGNIPLHLAVSKGNLDIVKKLIENGAYFNVQNNKKETPLKIAQESNHTEVKDFLEKIEKLFDELRKDALTESALQEIQSWISENKDYLNTRDRDGETPLHKAASKGHLDVVKNLIGNGAYFNLNNGEGKTPLKIAQESVYTEVKDFLEKIEKLFDELRKDALTESALQEIQSWISENKDYLNTRDRDGQTPLHFAAYKGYLTVVEKLIENGANVNSQNNNGNIPLHTAAWQGHLTVVEKLIEKGAAINSQDKNDETPLHYAAGKGYLTVVEKLIEKGADINSQDKNGKTPLHEASWGGHLTVVKKLIENGAYFDAKDKDEETPLEKATNNKVKDFLEKIEKLFGKLKEDKLTKNDLQEIQSWINENKDYLNTIDHLGNTPLHYATEKSHLNMVIKFIEEGASINIKNNDGYTPLAKFIEKLVGETSLALKKDVEFKASIKGDRGDPGPEGKRGEQGIQGPAGAQGLPGQDAKPEEVATKLIQNSKDVIVNSVATNQDLQTGVANKLKTDNDFHEKMKGDTGPQGPVRPKGDKGDSGLEGKQGSQREMSPESKSGKDTNISFKITKDKSYGEISSAKIVDGENYDVGTLSDIGYFFQGDELYIRNHLTDKNIRVPQEFYFLKAIHDSSGRLKFALCNSSGNLL